MVFYINKTNKQYSFFSHSYCATLFAVTSLNVPFNGKMGNNIVERGNFAYTCIEFSLFHDSMDCFLWHSAMSYHHLT